MAARQPVMSLDAGIDLALARAGLTRREAQLDGGAMGFYREGSFSSPFYEAAMKDVWRTPQLLSVLRNEIAMGSADTFKTLSVMSRLTGSGSRRDLLGNPVSQAIGRAGAPGYLSVVLGRLQDKGLLQGGIPDLSTVPPDVQAAAALILDVALDTQPYRQATFQQIDDMDSLLKRELGTSTLPSDPQQYRLLMTGYEKLDMAYLFAGGQDLTAAVQQASSMLAQVASSARYSWRLSTSWGDIVLNGAGDQQYVDPRALLIIDTGGNDTYVNCPAQKSASQWLSVVIDTEGSDKYLSDSGFSGKAVRDTESRKAQRGLPGPGSAFLGFTALVDKKGNDLYRSARASFGSAVMGVAVLIDEEGDDLYDTYADSLGFGKMGVGLLVDREGSDTYQGFTQTMGVGLTGGVGLVQDQAGNDKYLCEDKTVDFPSPQDPDQNVSMSIGAGVGFRLDYVHGRSLAGGVGLVIDSRGDDEYRCAVFGEGVGYWMGLGAVFDLDGNDKYNGVWYVQGSAAHFSVGALIDTDGADTYGATTNMSQGAGHDYSYGLLWDDRGKDSYAGGNLAFGAGNANGIGLFADLEGDDTYTAAGDQVFGRATAAPEGSLRTRSFSLGIFLDGYGNDKYPEKQAWARNGNGNVDVSRQGPSKSESQMGVFVDR